MAAAHGFEGRATTPGAGGTPARPGGRGLVPGDTRFRPGGRYRVPGGTPLRPRGQHRVPGGATYRPDGRRRVPGDTLFRPGGRRCVPGGTPFRPGGRGLVPGDTTLRPEFWPVFRPVKAAAEISEDLRAVPQPFRDSAKISRTPEMTLAKFPKRWASAAKRFSFSRRLRSAAERRRGNFWRFGVARKAFVVRKKALVAATR